VGYCPTKNLSPMIQNLKSHYPMKNRYLMLSHYLTGYHPTVSWNHFSMNHYSLILSLMNPIRYALNLNPMKSRNPTSQLNLNPL
jgi:hypothetical protein